MSLDPYDTGMGPPPNLYRYRENDERWTEKKYGDDILAVWQMSELPEDAVVTRITLIPYRGEKAVVAWQDGKNALPEGDLQPGESVDAAIKRIASEQAGINEPIATHLGHLRSKATVNSTTQAQAPGTITYQALYGIEVGSLSDFPADTAYERRILLQRDLNTLIRERYIFFRKEYAEALDRFLLDRLKANLRD
ncbi:MAG: hypothetical protein GEU75_14245 [Dehalococcoidia bacterium]|nr:hypothetical protein [Dehalococcoidia bacterium]